MFNISFTKSFSSFLSTYIFWRSHKKYDFLYTPSEHFCWFSLKSQNMSLSLKDKYQKKERKADALTLPDCWSLIFFYLFLYAGENRPFRLWEAMIFQWQFFNDHWKMTVIIKKMSKKTRCSFPMIIDYKSWTCSTFIIFSDEKYETP